MALRLTLKPNERVVINGCVVRNSERRQILVIENQADVVRESELLDEGEARTPVKEVYFFIQSALINSQIRDKLIPIIQKKLGSLVPVFHGDMSDLLIEAANYVSTRNLYKALRTIRPVMEYEAELYAMLDDKKIVKAAG